MPQSSSLREAELEGVAAHGGQLDPKAVMSETNLPAQVPSSNFGGSTHIVSVFQHEWLAAQPFSLHGMLGSVPFCSCSGCALAYSRGDKSRQHWLLAALNFKIPLPNRKRRALYVAGFYSTLATWPSAFFAPGLVVGCPTAMFPKTSDRKRSLSLDASLGAL